MKDQHNLYLKYDVLLLAEVYEKFRNRCLENYCLCPSHYVSAPALRQNSMLCMTKVELDHILHVDIYLFFEKGMRGGGFYISKKYIKANNKYLISYDSKKPTKYNITYWDKNNFFCCASPLDPAKFNLDKYNKSLRGRILEVGLEYSKELHKLHNDYILVSDKLEIKQEMLSNYQLKTVDDFDISIVNVK